jgi:hypothetical protein
LKVATPALVSYSDPLDLLRRFAPTPLKVHLRLESATVLLETNDLSFLPALSFAGVPAPSASSQSCLWKIVRDVDVRGQVADASIIMAGNLIFFSMGPACLIGADRERREILAFIGLDIDAPTFQQSILPPLYRLTEFVTHAAETSEVLRASEVVSGDRCNA